MFDSPPSPQAEAHRHGVKNVVRAAGNQGDVLTRRQREGIPLKGREWLSNEEKSMEVNQSHKEVNGNGMKCGHLTSTLMFSS